MIENKLLLLVIVPLAAAFINLFMPVIIRKLITAAVLIYTMILVYLMYRLTPPAISYFEQIIFSVDQLGLLTLLFIQLLGIIILLFSLKGVAKEIEKSFFFLYPLTIASCNGVVVSVHAFAFLIFWGLSGLTLYLYGTLGKGPDAPQAAKKTFIIVGGSDAFLILGFILMWIKSPATGWSLSAPMLPLDSFAMHLAFVFLGIAAFAKAGAFPFHTWVPEYTKEAPVESAAFLPASMDKLLGIFLLAKMMTSYFAVYFLINMILISIGALTVISAVMMALVQHNGRKLLGYHAVSQVGYMIMGVCSGNPVAFAGGLFHMINNVIYKSNLFLTLGSVEKRTRTSELDYMGGLGKVMPMTFLMAFIGALSISGIPPFSGFFSKWMIYQGLLQKTAALGEGYQLWLLLCILLALFGSALTLASFMKFLHAIYLGRRPEIFNSIKEAPLNQWIGTGILAYLCILFGLFAIEIPLKGLLYPVLKDLNMAVPVLPGFFEPGIVTVLFLTVFIIGLLVYAFTRKERYDSLYVGGMPANSKFRIAGTDFYNEIRNFTVIKSVYNMAEKKYLDLYDMTKGLTFSFSKGMQAAHPGQLQLYLFYIIAGFLIMLLLIN